MDSKGLCFYDRAYEHQIAIVKWHGKEITLFGVKNVGILCLSNALCLILLPPSFEFHILYNSAIISFEIKSLMIDWLDFQLPSSHTGLMILIVGSTTTAHLPTAAPGIVFKLVPRTSSTQSQSAIARPYHRGPFSPHKTPRWSSGSATRTAPALAPAPLALESASLPPIPSPR